MPLSENMASPNHESLSGSPSSSQSPHMSSSRVNTTDVSRSPHLSQPALSLQNPSSAAQHRQSFSDMRYPPSPRATRQPSISSIAVQELIDNPPQRAAPDARFAHRDWRTIRVGELTSPEDLKFIDVDASVEDATNVCTLPAQSLLC